MCVKLKLKEMIAFPLKISGKMNHAYPLVWCQWQSRSVCPSGEKPESNAAGVALSSQPTRGLKLELKIVTNKDQEK